jgi:hypothetical protein
MNKIGIYIPLCVLFLFSGCMIKEKEIVQVPEHDKLPEKLSCSLSPKKNHYLPFERVKLELSFKEQGTFKKEYGTPWYKINLTPLSTINDKQTYKVDWKNIHKNGYGPKNKQGIRWFFTRNWSGIIPQQEGEYKVKFVIATPTDYWQTEQMSVRIHIPREEIVPYNQLMNDRIDRFFQNRYSVRIRDTHHSMTPECPKERMPYEAIMKFISDYPYSAFTKFIISQAKRTSRYIRSAKVDYFKEDMDKIDEIIKHMR